MGARARPAASTVQRRSRRRRRRREHPCAFRLPLCGGPPSALLPSLNGGPTSSERPLALQRRALVIRRFEPQAARVVWRGGRPGRPCRRLAAAQGPDQSLPGARLAAAVLCWHADRPCTAAPRCPRRLLPPPPPLRHRPPRLALCFTAVWPSWHLPAQDLFITLVDDWGPLGYAAYIAVYAALEVLAVPAIPLTMTAGAIFGVGAGTAVVSVAATLACTVAFLIARCVSSAGLAAPPCAAALALQPHWPRCRPAPACCHRTPPPACLPVAARPAAPLSLAQLRGAGPGAAVRRQAPQVCGD